MYAPVHAPAAAVADIISMSDISGSQANSTPEHRESFAFDGSDGLEMLPIMHGYENDITSPVGYNIFGGVSENESGVWNWWDLVDSAV